MRILGEVKKEYADILREADHIFIEKLRNAGLYDEVSQAFVVFIPVKSVGVVGDARRYEYVVSLRAVKTIDFMTASFAHLPFDLLETVSKSHHQRGQRYIACGLRYLQQTACDDRVEVGQIWHWLAPAGIVKQVLAFFNGIDHGTTAPGSSAVRQYHDMLVELFMVSDIALD